MPVTDCRLASKFGGLVSVELHTDTAHDIKAIQYYGRRFHEICPEQFIVKVPYTAEGLIGARLLKDSGVRVNFTLEFSARENVLVTRVARPDYVNVFLGRIGAYMINNKLGDGSGAGEKAVISSQNWVTGLSADNPWQTKHDCCKPKKSRTSLNCLQGLMFLQCHRKLQPQAERN